MEMGKAPASSSPPPMEHGTWHGAGSGSDHAENVTKIIILACGDRGLYNDTSLKHTERKRDDFPYLHTKKSVLIPLMHFTLIRF